LKACSKKKSQRLLSAVRMEKQDMCTFCSCKTRKTKYHWSV